MVLEAHNLTRQAKPFGGAQITCVALAGDLLNGRNECTGSFYLPKGQIQTQGGAKSVNGSISGAGAVSGSTARYHGVRGPTRSTPRRAPPGASASSSSTAMLHFGRCRAQGPLLRMISLRVRLRFPQPVTALGGNGRQTNWGRDSRGRNSEALHFGRWPGIPLGSAKADVLKRTRRAGSRVRARRASRGSRPLARCRDRGGKASLPRPSGRRAWPGWPFCCTVGRGSSTRRFYGASTSTSMNGRELIRTPAAT
jgi:hypothetical protein